MHAQFNRFELENFARSAADAFLQGGADLNDSITKLAQENEFTTHHVDRVVQNANIFVNGALVSKAREGGEDPRVTFPLAKSAEINGRVHSGGSEKIASARKEAEVIDLFTVRKQASDHGALLDGTVGKMAPDPYASMAKSVDHVKLASAFVNGDADASKTDAASLSLACQTLENLEHRALTDHSLAKEAMDMSEGVLCQEIHLQLMDGNSPATVRDVIKQAELEPFVAEAMDKLVTKVAASIAAREGKSAVTDGSLINRDHPLIKKASKVKTTVERAVRMRAGLDKLSAAHSNAQREYSKAVREGR
jgi:hypothetical protein